MRSRMNPEKPARLALGDSRWSVRVVDFREIADAVFQMALLRHLQEWRCYWTTFFHFVFFLSKLFSNSCFSNIRFRTSFSEALFSKIRFRICWSGGHFHFRPRPPFLWRQDSFSREARCKGPPRFSFTLRKASRSFRKYRLLLPHLYWLRLVFWKSVSAQCSQAFL